MQLHKVLIAFILMAAMPFAMATDCASPQETLTVASGQYVEVSVTPCDTDIYTYSWDADSDITLMYPLDEDGFSIPSSCSGVWFIAPTVEANWDGDDDPSNDCKTFNIDVDVTNHEDDGAYTACTDTKCIQVTVCPVTCPVVDRTFCDADFDADSDVVTSYTYTGQYDSTMTVQWLVNSVDVTPVAPASPLTLDVTYGMLNHPDDDDGIYAQACTDVQFILTDAQGNTLLDCTEQVCLVPKPDATIAVGTTPSS